MLAVIFGSSFAVAAIVLAWLVRYRSVTTVKATLSACLICIVICAGYLLISERSVGSGIVGAVLGGISGLLSAPIWAAMRSSHNSR